MAKKLTEILAGTKPEKKGKQKPKEAAPVAKVAKLSGQGELFKGDPIPELSLLAAKQNADKEEHKEIGDRIKERAEKIAEVCAANGIKPGREYIDETKGIRVSVPAPKQPAPKTSTLSGDEVAFYADRRARQDKKLGDDTMPRPKREKPATAPLDVGTEGQEATH